MNKKNKQRKLESKNRRKTKLLHERKIAKEQSKLEKEVTKLQNQHSQIVKEDSVKELDRIQKAALNKEIRKYSIEEIKQRRRKLKNGQRWSK